MENLVSIAFCPLNTGEAPATDDGEKDGAGGQFG
jgi:hypothetical protein